MVFRSTLLLSLFLLSLSVLVISDEDLNCVYTFSVKTGSVDYAGTGSKISIRLSTASGDEFPIDDIVAWGGLKNHEHFVRGHLDILSGRGPCFSSLICRMNLTSDGTGQAPGWYVDYVDVNLIKNETTSQSCEPLKFPVDHWLTIGEPSYSLEAIIDFCGKHDMIIQDHNQHPIY